MLKNRVVTGLLSLAAVMVIVTVGPMVSAHCGKCLTDAKYFAGALEKTKMSLAAAASIAEIKTGGTAVHATVQRLEKGVNVEVHCLVDGAIMAVVVDGQSGDVTEKASVDNLDAHASK